MAASILILLLFVNARKKMIVLASLNDLIPVKPPREIQGLIDALMCEGYDETKPIHVEYGKGGFRIVDGHRRYYALCALASAAHDPCPDVRVPVKIEF